MVIAFAKEREVLTLAPHGFDVSSKLYIVPRTGSVLRLKPAPSGGDRIVYASPEAWRDWSARYCLDGGTFVTDLDDMPTAE